MGASELPPGTASPLASTMVRAESTALEALLVDRIERELRRAGGSLGDPAPVREAVRAVLLQPEFSPAEVAVLDGSAPGSEIAPLARVIALRVESALRAGMEAVATEESLELPRVLYADGDPASITAAVTLTLRGAQAGTLMQSMPAPHGGPTPGESALLLAAPEAYEQFQQQSATLTQVGTQSFFTAEEVLDGTVTYSSGPVSDVEVARVPRDAGLPELADRARRKAAETGVTATLGQRALAGDLTGELLDRKYRVLRKIGSGGFGAVYEAEDEILDTRVAIKVLNTRAARSKGSLEEFKEEARRLTKLRHPNIVDWKAFGETEDGTLFFVMELLNDGEELGDLLERENVLETRRAGRILLQLLDALRTAHHLSETESMLHLDLKPGNVFVLPGRVGRQTDLVKVIDFGIGQYISRDSAAAQGAHAGPAAIEAPAPAGPSRPAGQTLPGATRPATVPLGGSNAPTAVTRVQSCTPEYAAPEQCAHLLPGRDAVALDGRADLYSVGVIGYEMLTGDLPYERPKSTRARRELLIRRIEEPHRRLPLKGSRLRKDLSRFIERCLEREREARWPDARAAYEALYAILNPPVWRLLAKVSAVFVALFGVLFYAFGGATAATTLIDGRHPDTGEVLAQGARLQFSARRPELAVEFGVTEGEPPELAREWELLEVVEGAGDGEEGSSERAAGQRLEGWSVRPDPAGGRLLFEAPPGLTASEARLARLRARDGSHESRGDFYLVYIAEGLDVSGAVPRIVGRDPSHDRFVPAGQRLEIPLDLEPLVPGDLEVLELKARDAGDNWVATRFSRLEPSSRTAVYVLDDMRVLGLERGAGSILARVSDRAGQDWEAAELELPATVITEVLTFEVLEFEGLDEGVGVWYLTGPGIDVQVELSTEAYLSWQLVRGPHRFKGALPGRGEEARRTYTIDLEAAMGEGLDLTLLQEDGKAYDDGQLTVTVEDVSFTSRVIRQEGEQTERLRFGYLGEAPVLLEARLREGVTSPADPRLLVTNGPLPVLELRTPHTGSDVQVKVQGEDLPETLIAKAAPTGGGAAVAECRLPIQDPGRYELFITPAYVVRAGEEEQSIEGERSSYVLVLDQAAPEVTLTPWSLGEARRVTQLDPGSITWRAVVEDDSAGTLDWSVWLQREPGGERVGVGPWDQESEDWLAGGAPLELAPERPWQRDGFYRLVVGARDEAGNVRAAGTEEEPSGADLTFDFEVAARPPSCRILGPAGEGRTWDPVGEDTFELWLKAWDPNGVSGVRAVVRPAEEESAGALEPVRIPESADGSPAWAVPEPTGWDDGLVSPTFEWKPRARFLHPWSEVPVVIEVYARDAAGNELAEPVTRRATFPWIDERFKQLLVAEPPGEGPEISPMRLIGKAGQSTYVFGGQGGDAERDRFLRAGLVSPFRGDYKPRKVVFKTAAIVPYYVDEREASEGEFARFVRAPEGQGYGDPELWPRLSSGPDPDRRAAFLARLDPNSTLPVTGVSWDEAYAYARWVGKRLMSLVEWEYAVRGGPEHYRVYPSDEPEDEPWAAARRDPAYRLTSPHPVDLVRDPADDAGSALPRGSNASLHGILSLTTNVMEWTSTPYFSGYDQPYGGADDLWYLRPEEAAAQATLLPTATTDYFAVGGSYRNPDTALHFSSTRRRAREGRSDLGFRCALSLAEARELERTGSPSGVRYSFR